MAVETLCPLRAGNSAMLAFDTLKIGGSSPSIMLRIPVKVKKFPSMASFEELAGIANYKVCEDVRITCCDDCNYQEENEGLEDVC